MIDLIDRAALIKALNEEAMKHHESHVPMVEHDFRELIHSADRVVIRDMTAHWCDMHGNKTISLLSVYRSSCGGWSQYASQYCPKCGAKMEGIYG